MAPEQYRRLAIRLKPPLSVHAKRAALRYRRRLVLAALEGSACRFHGPVLARHRPLACLLDRIDAEIEAGQ